MCGVAKKLEMIVGSGILIPVLDPNPDSDFQHFLNIFNPNSNSNSIFY